MCKPLQGYFDKGEVVSARSRDADLRGVNRHRVRGVFRYNGRRSLFNRLVVNKDYEYIILFILSVGPTVNRLKDTHTR